MCQNCPGAWCALGCSVGCAVGCLVSCALTGGLGFGPGLGWDSLCCVGGAAAGAIIADHL